MNQQKKPNGKDLLATLISLLAEQEGVKIQYILTDNTKGAINNGN